MISQDIKNLIDITEGKLVLGAAIGGTILYKKDPEFANTVDNLKDNAVKLVKIVNSHGEKFSDDPNNQDLIDGIRKLIKYITTATTIAAESRIA